MEAQLLYLIFYITTCNRCVVVYRKTMHTMKFQESHIKTQYYYRQTLTAREKPYLLSLTLTTTNFMACQQYIKAIA